MRSYDEMKKLAERAVKIAEKMNQLGLSYLLRSNNEFGGVIFSIEDTLINGDRRRIAHIIGPDYKLYREYLDYKEEGALDVIDARILTFPDSPFVLTARTRPALTDEENDLEFIIVGDRANQLARLRIEVDKRNAEIKELSFLLDSAMKRIDALETELKTKSEEIRRNFEVVRSVTEENTRLRSYLSQLTTLVEQYMIGDYEKTAALEHLLQKAKTIGRAQAMDVYDMVEQVVKKHRKIQDEIAMMTIPDVGDINKSFREILREMLPDIAKSITPHVIEALKTSGVNVEGIDTRKIAKEVAEKLREEQVAHA